MAYTTKLVAEHRVGVDPNVKCHMCQDTGLIEFEDDIGIGEVPCFCIGEEEGEVNV